MLIFGRKPPTAVKPGAAGTLTWPVIRTAISANEIFWPAAPFSRTAPSAISRSPSSVSIICAAYLMHFLLTSFAAGTTTRRRNPAFRERVLRAYEYRCCVCSFDLRIGNVTAGLEAAHIQWFTAGGPDEENNGFAMCALHHKLLDLGAFTVEPVNLTMRFSQNLQLGESTRAQLLAFHGAGIITPQSTVYRPERKYLEWHGDEVFKKPGRE